MTQQYNQRPFIYRSREDIDAFLEESQLWRDIYEVFLRVKDNAYYLKVPSVKMFNEVRYQCVRLMLDKHPEENVYGNYLNDARDTLGWRYASDLCFSRIAWTGTMTHPFADKGINISSLRSMKLVLKIRHYSLTTLVNRSSQWK